MPALPIHGPSLLHTWPACWHGRRDVTRQLDVALVGGRAVEQEPAACVRWVGAGAAWTAAWNAPAAPHWHAVTLSPAVLPHTPAAAHHTHARWFHCRSRLVQHHERAVEFAREQGWAVLAEQH